MLQMFSHGLITGCLFLLVGVIYERTHNRDLSQFGGLGSKIPVYGGLLSFASFASLGLPGLAGFVSEFFIFRGAFALPYPMNLITALAGLGIVLNAAYLLWMVQRVLFGPLNPKWAHVPDVDRREVLSLAPLMALTVIVGIFPAILLSLMNGSLVHLVRSLMAGG
jgi:NADH-quinone oxidoreductase subunit M